MTTAWMRRAARRWLPLLFGGLTAFGVTGAQAREFPADTRMAVVEAAALPLDARQTIALIERGGPFPYRRDGVTFHNRERRLPGRPAGHYREYAVPTPGARDRGPRRIVVGKAGERYYTDDHYRSFSRIRE